MKAILISIKPKYVAEILNGKKTLEIRKTCPKCDLPIDVYIYCTKDRKQALIKNNINGTYHLDTCYWDTYESNLNGKVVAKFTLNKIDKFSWESCSRDNNDYYKDNGEVFDYKQACLTYKEMFEYIKSGDGYTWHIDNLEVFDIPRGLQPYFDLDKAPQSWQYLEKTIVFHICDKEEL